jgi:hypothetical protein
LATSGDLNLAIDIMRLVLAIQLARAMPRVTSVSQKPGYVESGLMAAPLHGTAVNVLTLVQNAVLADSSLCRMRVSSFALWR